MLLALCNLCAKLASTASSCNICAKVFGTIFARRETGVCDSAYFHEGTPHTTGMLRHGPKFGKIPLSHPPHFFTTHRHIHAHPCHLLTTPHTQKKFPPYPQLHTTSRHILHMATHSASPFVPRKFPYYTQCLTNNHHSSSRIMFRQ